MKKYILIVLVFFNAGCQKEVSSELLNNGPEETITPCTGEEQYEFIKAEFGGVLRVFDKKQTDELFYNVHIFNETGTRQDQMNLIRFDSSLAYAAHIYYLGSRFHQKALPYTLPHSNQEAGEKAELQFLDVHSRWYSQCNGCPDDDANYFAYTKDSELKITITDTACSYVKGTFAGTASTKTGKKLQVTNGSFNIKITRVDHL